MVEVSTSIIIERPREEVARFASDPANARRWYANIIDARPRTDGPLSIGSEVDFEARFLRRTSATPIEWRHTSRDTDCSYGRQTAPARWPRPTSGSRWAAAPRG